MEKSIKILIPVIIILVGVLSLAGGLLLSNYLNHPLPVVNNTTNVTVNQTNDTTSTTTNYIGQEAAINIAKSYFPNGPHIAFNAELITDANPPYYLVTATQYNEAGNYSGTYSTVVKVNAITGQVL